ncbi:hypothetical protein SAURM35S_04041 [Streptomyces aurantiogriseus]
MIVGLLLIAAGFPVVAVARPADWTGLAGLLPASECVVLRSTRRGRHRRRFPHYPRRSPGDPAHRGRRRSAVPDLAAAIAETTHSLPDSRHPGDSRQRHGRTTIALLITREPPGSTPRLPSPGCLKIAVWGRRARSRRVNRLVRSQGSCLTSLGAPVSSDSDQHLTAIDNPRPSGVPSPLWCATRHRRCGCGSSTPLRGSSQTPRSTAHRRRHAAAAGTAVGRFDHRPVRGPLGVRCLRRHRPVPRNSQRAPGRCLISSSRRASRSCGDCPPTVPNHGSR